MSRPMAGMVARLTTATVVALGLVATAPVLSAPGNADGPSCADAVTSAPTGPATVSAASTPYGRVLVVGSGDYAGCSLYVLTSDELHALSGADFACSDNHNALFEVLGTPAPCDTFLWPALLTDGPPVAGPGVNPTLLGTVARSDLSLGDNHLGTVHQVTYAGLPLYRFIFDEAPGETEGASLFDPVTSPTGNWYLVHPSRGLPAVGTAQLQPETAPVGDSGTDQTVLSVSMDDTFSLFDSTPSFPVYTLNADSGHQSACQGECAVSWLPVLTSGRPQAASGVDAHALGTIVRPDDTHQVTYDGRPLYLFAGDAYIADLPYGTARIDGDGAVTDWGTFHAIALP